MVATEEEKVLRVLDLVGQEETDRLQRLLTPVDIVAQEEVVGLGGKAAVLEETEEVIVLAVDVAADLEWSFKLEQDRLRQKDFSRFETQASNLVFRQLHIFSWPRTSDYERGKSTQKHNPLYLYDNANIHTSPMLTLWTTFIINIDIACS